MSDNVDALAHWNELKKEIESLEEDLTKNLVKHNASAGVRARKGLRSLSKKLAALVKQSLAVSKAVAEQKAAAKVKKPAKAAK